MAVAGVHQERILPQPCRVHRKSKAEEEGIKPLRLQCQALTEEQC